jgi:transposase-like protein
VDLRQSLSNFTPILNRIGSDASAAAIHDVRGEAKRGAAIKRIRRLSANDRADLVTQYRSGQTVYQLADRYGIHRHTVSKHLRDASVRLRLDGLTREQAAEAPKLYESGLSIVKVAALYGVAPRTVLACLRRHGVTMRDTHGRPRWNESPPDP